MDPTNQESVAVVTNPTCYLTTLASVAAVIDITVGALSSIDGDGIELISSDGTTMTPEGLHDTVSSFVYRALNDSTISHDAIQGSMD